MKKPIIKLAACCLFIFISCHTRAQTANSDSAGIRYAINFFNKGIGQQSRLYNGSEYVLYDPVIKNNPNFHDHTDWRTGAVNFDGFNYSNVPLIYDLYKDLLVALLYNNFSRYVFQNGKVASFDMDGHHFVYISTDTANTPGFTSGYYDQLYAGKTQVLARYAKSIQNRSSGTEIETYFTKTSTQLFLKKEGKYVAVNSEGELLDALKDHKKEVQQYLRSNSLKFKKAPEDELVKSASFYDHLNN